jgi:hypothetical protein
MDYAALVTTIGNALTQLDTALTNSKLNNQPAQWQQLYALRKHLDDQQRAFVQQSIVSDNAAFQALANSIQAATNTLDQEIKVMNQIDSIITVVSQISANLDQVLKLA